MSTSPAEHWRHALQQWGIPKEILDRAPRSPWIHPTESFRPTGDLRVATPSFTRALEALVADGPRSHASERPSVLDIGCGGGRASLALAPEAEVLVGVDHQASMLEVFAEEATHRGVVAQVIEGDWPAVATSTPTCDVVVCHHVAYNVPELVPFVDALTAHAARRVVMELPDRHPLSNLSAAWQRFWNLERPTSPTASDALDVVRSTGVDARAESFEQPDHKGDVTDRDVEHTRVRLCLPADRDAEVREFLEHQPRPPRRVTTIWWNT